MNNIKIAVRKILFDPSFRKKAEELKNIYAKFDAPALAVDYVKDLITKQKEIRD